MEPDLANHAMVSGDTDHSAATGSHSNASRQPDIDANQPSGEQPSSDETMERSASASILVRDIRSAGEERPVTVQVGISPIISPKPAEQHAIPFEPPAAGARPYTPASHSVTAQLVPAVQRGYDLAQRGALYAAQAEFVQVLRRIAQAKDAADSSDKHSQALAAGLRALDEAEDFVPEGIQLEAELNVPVVASSHRTPVLCDCHDEVLPQRAVELYHAYAEEQLAQAVAGEQAGSMALHGLGKIFALLAARNDDDAVFTQRATTMYTAALVVRRDNHLAANELGVLLCRNGRAAEAAQLFERTIDAEPSALAYHNLAVAQRKLGMHGQAAANQQESRRLAAWERGNGAVSRRAGVQWVSAEELSRVAQPALLSPAVYNAAKPVSPTNRPQADMTSTPHPSPWQRTVAAAKSLPLPGFDRKQRVVGPTATARVAAPLRAPAGANQPRWR
jgi:tetratricopeptide (TPR) repeat protein